MAGGSLAQLYRFEGAPGTDTDGVCGDLGVGMAYLVGLNWSFL
jgi:hypothetical protein